MTKLRKILLETKTIKLPQGKKGLRVDSPFPYKQNLIDTLNAPPIDERSGQPRGFGPTELRKRIKIQKLVEACVNGGELLLEQTDWGTLKECVNAQRWLIMDEAIVVFIDAVENAEEVEVKEKKPK